MTERIIALIDGLRHGLTVLRSPSLLAGTVVWSLVLWLMNALAFYVAFEAFDIPVGFLGALLMQGILVFGITVQLTPGFVGQFEAAIVAALALFRVPNDVASSYAIAYHIHTFVPIILLGAWSLARTPVALSDLRAARQSMSVAAVTVAGACEGEPAPPRARARGRRFSRSGDAVLPA